MPARSRPAVEVAQSTGEQHIILHCTLRLSAAKLLIGNHPLILPSRALSSAVRGQDFLEID
jgi:hypothetical protein